MVATRRSSTASTRRFQPLRRPSARKTKASRGSSDSTKKQVVALHATNNDGGYQDTNDMPTLMRPDDDVDATTPDTETYQQDKQNATAKDSELKQDQMKQGHQENEQQQQDEDVALDALLCKEESTECDVVLVYERSHLKRAQALLRTIVYSERYDCGEEEFRHAILPLELMKLIPDSHKNKLLTESEWRELGLRMSLGWEHYAIHRPEPHILLFKRKIRQ